MISLSWQSLCFLKALLYFFGEVAVYHRRYVKWLFSRSLSLFTFTSIFTLIIIPAWPFSRINGRVLL